MADEEIPFWTNQAFLRNMQYVTDRNLAARQSIYAFQVPRIDLPAAVIDSLGLSGGELIADVGCGNGSYLAELHRRGHHGALIGLDASPGMLKSARERAKAVAVLNGDAVALPLRTGTADVLLAMHMLYHLPDGTAALKELRRVTAPGGRVVIGLNGGDHLREMRVAINTVMAEHGYGDNHLAREWIRLDDGEELAARFFGSVVRQDFVGELKLPGPEPVEAYVRSMGILSDVADQDRIVREVISRLDFGQSGLRTGGFCTVRTHSGWLICS